MVLVKTLSPSRISWAGNVYGKEKIYADLQFATISAIRNKQIHPFPSNVGWWDYPAPQGAGRQYPKGYHPERPVCRYPETNTNLKNTEETP